MTTRNAFPDGHASGHWLRKIYITDPNVTTYITGSDTTKIKVRMVAGGGGGGGLALVSTSNNDGAAGASGSYAEKTFAVKPNTLYVCAIGAAGTGGAAGANNGGTGGNTTLTVAGTTVTCHGGGGGGGAAAGASGTVATAGAISTNGDLNLPGVAGGNGATTSTSSVAYSAIGGAPFGGMGASSPNVFAGSSQTMTLTAGTGYGYGGASAAASGTVAAQAGLAGGGGAIFIDEFA